MTRKPKANLSEEGVALILVAGLLVVLLLFIGLAIDLGRAYLVKAQLTKAVDGAALAAARALNTSSTPEKDEAIRIFRANFPNGYLGTSSVTDPATDTNFFNKTYDAESGANIITVRAQATLAATFMRLAGFDQFTVAGMGEARRRLVDLSLAIDCSGSIAGDWNTVRDAARQFINSFDSNYDRMAITLFSDGANVSYAMPAGMGFNKISASNAIPNALPGGSTSMADAFYRAWDELRSVPSGSQSGLRVIVLFTDGTPNGVPGNFKFNGVSYVRELNTNDFPNVGPNTTDTPSLFGLAYTDCSSGPPPHCSYNPSLGSSGYFTPNSPSGWNSPQASSQVPWLPTGATSTHPNHRSAGIPTSFPLQSSSLTVNGVIQSTARDLRNFNATSGYPADIHNTNNAARNLVEIIADAARREYPASGDYPIRVYTIGMGANVNYLLGTIPEKSSDILKRIANDKTSADYNSAQRAGKYYYAQTASDVNPAFQALRNEIVRLSK